MKSPNDVKDYNFFNVVDFIVAERLTSYYSNEEIKAAAFEELEDEKLETVDIAWLGEKQSFKVDKQFESFKLLNMEIKHSKPSIKSSLILELKYLPLKLK